MEAVVNVHRVTVKILLPLGVAILFLAGSQAFGQSGDSRKQTGAGAYAIEASNPQLASDAINRKVEALLAQMTLREKVGQLAQYSAGVPSGPGTGRQDYEQMIANGDIGAMINEGDAHTVFDRNKTIAFQRIAVEKSRLHIPLLFGLDVIHGYRTIFPEPLGLAASFDPEIVKATAHLAAEEASADGIRWTYSPMVDIARDARWGRIVEGAGEDPYLGSAMARAYVQGYQGASLSDRGSIAACVKHYAAYGAVTAGREYNAAEVPELTLQQVYLPPYRAAVEAGAVTAMSALNSLNGVPETADRYTLTQILRNEWGFNGFVVSDWGSIHELVNHGVAHDDSVAARKALTAGVEMDMEGNAYGPHLVSLVRSGAIPEAAVDEAVRRIFRVKFALGLFERPYPDGGAYAATAARRELVRRAAEESLVLLQNNTAEDRAPLLPIRPEVRTVALIGPLADSKDDMLGSYSAGDPKDVATLRDAMIARMKARGGELIFAEGTKALTQSHDGFDAALLAAQKADLVILALGENADMTSEATSRTNLDLPGNQEALLQAIAATGKPIVLVVFSGRPLVLTWAAEHVPAILEAWFPGTEAGPALANVLFGDVNPSGKLPVSFPRSVGQEPLFLGQLSTGRPVDGAALSYPPANSAERFFSRYIDVPNSPLFPFGHGLSYTQFEYSGLVLNIHSLPVAQAKAKPRSGEAGPVEVKVLVRNSGTRTGTEVAQLYLRIRDTSVAQPVRALKGFARVTLQPGESTLVRFSLGFDELSFVNSQGEWVIEPAEYTVFVGGSSEATASGGFKIVE